MLVVLMQVLGKYVLMCSSVLGTWAFRGVDTSLEAGQRTHKPYTINPFLIGGVGPHGLSSSSGSAQFVRCIHQLCMLPGLHPFKRLPYQLVLKRESGSACPEFLYAGFPQFRVPFSGTPMIRIMIFWGPPIWANYPHPYCSPYVYSRVPLK